MYPRYKKLTIKRLVSSTFLLGILAFATAPALAAVVPDSPARAIFYQNEASLEVEGVLPFTTLPDGSTGLHIVLPSNVDRDSFFLLTGERPATTLIWDTADIQPIMDLTADTFIAPDDEPLAGRRDILLRVVEAQGKIRESVRESSMLQYRINLLDEAMIGENLSTSQSRQELDSELVARLPELYLKLDLAKQSQQRYEAMLEKAVQDLEKFDAETSLVHLYIPWSSGSAKELKVLYGYTLPASYQNMYNIFGKPADKSVSIEQVAVLEQHSGFAWNDVEISISTAPRTMNMLPPYLYPWNVTVQSEDNIAYEARQRASAPVAAGMAMDMSVDVAAAPKVKPAPTFAELSTFRLWSIGKQDLVSGAPNRIVLQNSDYAADYFYLLRPGRDPLGYLTAEVNFAKDVEFPAGMAQIFLDGISIGKNSWSATGKKTTLSFGSDPAVRGQMVALKNIAGEQGMISKDQTHEFLWDITIKNGRNRAVAVRVEDPMPIPGDKQIKVNVRSEPTAEQIKPEDGSPWLLRWSFELDAGAEKNIKHAVEIIAPAKEKINRGR